MSLPRVIISLLVAALGVGRAPQGVPSARGTIRGVAIVPAAAMVAPRPRISDLGASVPIVVDRRRVVVFLEATPALEAMPRAPVRARMDQRDEQFVPRILAITTGSLVEFPNSDTTFHNVFSLSRTRTFDLGRYPPGRNGAIRFDRAGIVPVFCDIHAHMSGYILVFNHPFFTVSDDSGRFTLRDVPAGSYALSVWSELGQTPSRRITVNADSTTDADFEIGRDTK